MPSATCGSGIGLGQRHLDERSLSSEWRAQFVRGTGNEMPLRFERCFKAGEEIVECLAEPAEFIRTVEIEAASGLLSGGLLMLW